MITAGDLLRSYARAIDGRDWDALAGLLAPGFTCRFAHTEETFDAEGLLALNRDYPGGPWRFEVEDLVDAGDRGVLLARISDRRGVAPEVHRVAVLASVEGDRLGEVVELWAEVTAADPARRP